MVRKLALCTLLFAVSAYAQLSGQSGTASRITRGIGEPSPGACTNASDVSKIYVRMNTAAANSLRLCANTGVGTYGWESPGGSGSGSLPTTGAMLKGDGAGGASAVSGTGVINVVSGVPTAVVPATVQASKLPTPAAEDGTTDETAAFNSAVAGTTVLLRNGVTYMLSSAWTPAANTTWICGANTIIKKTAGTTTTYMLAPTTANVTIENCVFDPNGVLKGSGNLYSIFISGATNIKLRNVRFANSSTVQPTMGGILVFSSSGIIDTPKFDNTIGGTHIKIDQAAGKFFKVQNIQSDGSQENAIQVTVSSGYTAEAVPINVEIAGGRISNVTDRTGVSTGPLGNAVDVFQADGGVLIHDLTTDTTRFSGVRITTSNNVKVNNVVIKGAQESAMYCGELGGIRNECSNITILDSASGVNMTNVSQRAGTGGADDTNITSNVTCRNVRDYCVHTEHDIIAGYVKCDGVVACVTLGYGNTSHDNVVGTVVSTRSNTAYPKPVAAILVDKSINTGTDLISSSVVSTGATSSFPVIPVSLPDGATISAITKANPMVVTYSNSPAVTPAVGSTWCFKSIGGMVELNGQCLPVTAQSGSTMTFGGTNSTAYTTFANPTGGPGSSAFLLTDPGGAFHYSLPTSLSTGAATFGLPGVPGCDWFGDATTPAPIYSTICGPDTGTTAITYKLPAANPPGPGTSMMFPAPASNISQGFWGGTIYHSHTAYQITWATGTSATVKMPTGSAVPLTKSAYLAAAGHTIVGTWTGTIITPATIPTSVTAVLNLCDATDCSGTAYAIGTMVFAPIVGGSASELGWGINSTFSLLDTTHMLFSTTGWMGSTTTSGITTKATSSVAAGLSVTLTASTWYLVLSFKPSGEENTTDTVNLQTILVEAKS